MNYYEILEVSQNASPEVIKAAYKSLIQRYHPDRNPGNPEIAGHASLVVQAYEVLSDSTKRAAYDIQLKQSLAEHLSIIRNKSWDDINPADLVIKEKESYGFLWLLVAVILLSGWFILSPSKKMQSPESELKEINLSFENNQLTEAQKQAKFKRIDEIFREHPELVKKEASGKANELDTRTVPLFITNLTVTLKVADKSPEDSGKSSKESDNPVGSADKSLVDTGNFPASSDKPSEKSTEKLTEKLPEKSGDSSGDTDHVLFIPVLGAIVGTFDSEKVIRHIESNKVLITRKLAEKLAYAKYEELLKIDGELYLKKIILDSIDDTSGTDRNENYPSSGGGAPGHYGVVDVLLPESYTVH